MMKIKKQPLQIFLFFRGLQKEAKDYFSSFVPSGLFNILFYLLSHDCHATLVNLSDMKKQDLKHFLNSHKIDIAFISTFFGNHSESINLIKQIKSFNTKTVTVMGGPYTVLGDEIIRRVPELDFVIKGEGEIPSLKIINLLQNKEHIKNIEGLCYRNSTGLANNAISFHPNIDDFFYLPSKIADYCKYVNKENFSILITSRGCPFKCNFCSSPLLWQNRIRYHSITKLIDYVKDLRINFNEIFFSIRDDNFLMSKKRVLAFTKAIKELRLYFLWNTQGSVKFIDEEVALALAQSGCDQVQMGIESASKRALSFLNKNVNIEKSYEVIHILRKHLIRPFGYFIGGFDESKEEVEETCHFIKHSGIIDAVISPLVIYPGTPFSKKIPLDNFFSKDEIIYYSKQSYEKYKKKYIAALEYAFNRNFFNLNEIKSSPTSSFLKNIVSHFYFLQKGNLSKAISALDGLENENPWKAKLLNDITD